MIMTRPRNGPASRRTRRRWRRRCGPTLLKVFPPALLGRLVTIPYFPLSPEMLGGIVRLQLDRIGKRIADNHERDVRLRRRGGRAHRLAVQRSRIRAAA